MGKRLTATSTQTPTTNRLVLPLPPTQNHAYRNVMKDGRRMRVRTHEAKRYHDETQAHALVWRTQARWSVPDAGVKVIARMWYFWPDRRRQDTHNRTKILLDALEGILFADDRYVLVREMDYQLDRENPRVEIELSVMQEATQT